MLIDGQFASVPHIVVEGRRVTANVERVANLFITSTFYALGLSVAIVISSLPFPFLPRHLTLVGSLTIGIPAFFLALAPEGTRKPTRYWRSGFWHIARRAKVPVVPVALDYGRRELRLGEAVALTGDADEDMAVFREFFEGARGFTAEFASPIELAPEKKLD